MDVSPEEIVPGDLDLTDSHPDPLGPPVGIMVDLETWGTGNNAAVISIGAVKFNRTGVTDMFHVGITPQSAQAAGLSIDAGTILWWMDPERHLARREWLGLEKVELVMALDGFAQWVGGDKVPLYGNGATFDNVILRSAFAAVGLEYPIQFYNDLCYRSIKRLAPDITLVRVGVHHNALDDARSQALHLIAIADQLGVEL